MSFYSLEHGFNFLMFKSENKISIDVFSVHLLVSGKILETLHKIRDDVAHWM